MESAQLKASVLKEIGCSELTYKAAYSELVTNHKNQSDSSDIFDIKNIIDIKEKALHRFQCKADRESL